MKKIEVYVINAKTMECTKQTIEDSLETYYKLINTDCISVIGRMINGKMTQIICDEEGKLKQHQFVSAIEQNNMEMLVGNLVIKSTDEAIPKIIDKYGVLVYEFKH